MTTTVPSKVHGIAERAYDWFTAVPTDPNNTNPRYVWVRIARVALIALAIPYFIYTVASGDMFTNGNVVDFVMCSLIFSLIFYLSWESGTWNGLGWQVIAGCMLCWAIGITAKIIAREFFEPLPVPSFADIFLMTRALLAALGLFLLLRIWATKIPMAILLNGLTVGLSMASVGAAFAEPMSRQSDSSFGVWVTLLYPILSICIFGFSLGVYVVLDQRTNAILIFGNVGIAIFTAIDTINFFYYSSGHNEPNLGLICGWLLGFGVIALASSAVSPQYSMKWNNSPTSTILVYISIIIAVSIMFFGFGGYISNIIAAATILTATTRTYLVHREVAVKSDEMEFRSVTDVLTGLANRAGLYERIEERIRHKDTRIALLLMDLDHFKAVNDTLGHEYGDHLLIGVGKRLAEQQTDKIFPARLGGDEFAVLLRDVTSMEQAVEIAEEIHNYLVRPLIVNGTPMSIEASIGVALLDGDLNRETLMSQADAAMYSAKRNGYGVRGWDDSMNSTSVEKLQLTGELREAIEKGELYLAYQPKMQLDGKTLIGVESLVRWEHPVHGIVSPNDFIPHAESTALIHPLTEFVLTSAVRQAAQWYQQGTPISVAVNLSGRSLSTDKIVDSISLLLAEHQLPPYLLDIEVTESAIMEDVDAAASILHAISALGVSISLDDFGAGNTTLAQLPELPWDTIKIDRCLVHEAIHAPKRRVILRTMVLMGDELGHNVIVEGVEDEATLNYLRTLEYQPGVQGYVYSPPLRSDQLQVWMSEEGIITQKASESLRPKRVKEFPLGKGISY